MKGDEDVAIFLLIYDELWSYCNLIYKTLSIFRVNLANAQTSLRKFWIYLFFKLFYTNNNTGKLNRGVYEHRIKVSTVYDNELYYNK